MTVLVTGATGLLGSHLIELLLERGERPRALVRPGDSVAGLPGTVDIAWGDLADRDALAEAVRGVDTVLNCAARTGPWGPEAEYQRSNVGGLENLVAAALDGGVQRLVHVSSITVHGNDVRGLADETAPFRVEPNPYSRSKVAGERLLESLVRTRRAPVTIVRPGWIYGPRDTASFGRFAAMIEHGRMIVVGPGSNHVPLIHVRDAAHGVLLAAAVEAAVGRAYLLVNDERVTQRQFLDAIAAQLNVAPPARRLPYRLLLAMGTAAETAARVARSRKAPPLMRYGIQLLGGENRFVIDRARRELGFAPQLGLAEGVKSSVDWYRARAPRAAAA